MSDFVEVAKAYDLGEGAMKRVTAGDADIVLACVGGVYYAAQARCPHMGGDLSRGRLAGTTVTCPRHGSQFDLADGRNVRWTAWTGIKLSAAKVLRSPRPLRTYPVKREGDSILMDVG